LDPSSFQPNRNKSPALRRDEVGWLIQVVGQAIDQVIESGFLKRFVDQDVVRTWLLAGLRIATSRVLIP
jgi:hypothetical protein